MITQAASVTNRADAVRGRLAERIAEIQQQLAGMRAKHIRLSTAIRERETHLNRLEASATSATPPARHHDTPTY